MYGIELLKKNGNHNGSYKKRQYFKCKDKYGCFVSEKGIKLNESRTSCKFLLILYPSIIL